MTGHQIEARNEELEMTEEEQELRKLDTWDLDQVVVTPGVKNPRAVVSDSFSRDEFERVAIAAERRNQETSEFIRAAAIAEAEGAEITSLGLAGSSFVATTTESYSQSSTSTEAKPIFRALADAITV